MTTRLETKLDVQQMLFGRIDPTLQEFARVAKGEKMQTDPIADMLTRIRNACMVQHRRVVMPSSKMKVSLARILR